MYLQNNPTEYYAHFDHNFDFNINSTTFVFPATSVYAILTGHGSEVKPTIRFCYDLRGKYDKTEYD